ncbi:MAG: alpha/beta hydrolase [Gemmatimonadota bacterium]|nr:alpha/beta hydrolase [Gemmatimonadota bacterium]
MWIPTSVGPHPVVVLLHGGCWLDSFSLDLMHPVARDLSRRGYAVWNLEYRRVGEDGGGWPGTFRDAARGIRHLRSIADDRPLDLERVVVAGHSAGGHLALWAVGRGDLPPGSPVAVEEPLEVRGVLGLAPITDLEAYRTRGAPSCASAVTRLMGGTRAEVPDRYEQGSPIERLPAGEPQGLIAGEEDAIVPAPLIAEYADRARALGDEVRIEVVPGADHFAFLEPTSTVWTRAVEWIETRVGAP